MAVDQVLSYQDFPAGSPRGDDRTGSIASRYTPRNFPLTRNAISRVRANWKGCASAEYDLIEIWIYLKALWDIICVRRNTANQSPIAVASNNEIFPYIIPYIIGNRTWEARWGFDWPYPSSLRYDLIAGSPDFCNIIVRAVSLPTMTCVLSGNLFKFRR